MHWVHPIGSLERLIQPAPNRTGHLADRLMPVAGFTADGKQQAQVSINITGLSSGSTDTGVIIDGESGDVEDV